MPWVQNRGQQTAYWEEAPKMWPSFAATFLLASEIYVRLVSGEGNSGACWVIVGHLLVISATSGGRRME